LNMNVYNPLPPNGGYKSLLQKEIEIKQEV